MAIKLEYKGDTPIPVEIEGFTPDWARDKSLAEIEQFEIYHGNRKLPLAEMFAVGGDPGDEQMHFEGNLSGVHWIGAHMSSGSVTIHGPGGRHIGSELSGGEITVEGDAGDWVGGEMHGGKIHVHGSAGHLVGSAYRGSARGMTGGLILIDGDVGNELGHTMRRGWIAVGGAAGDMIGFNMIAGSIFVFGSAGIRPGAGMRRGTIGLFGDDVPNVLPSFRYNSRLRPTILSVMFRELQTHGFRVDPALVDSLFDLYSGDLVAIGKGELLLRHQATA